MPEPRPASASGTPLMAIVSSGSIVVPMPRPISAKGTNSVGKYEACSSTPLSSSSATTTIVMPATTVRTGPSHRITRAVVPSDSAPTVSVIGRNARPVSQAP